jgi:hypothetical protein
MESIWFMHFLSSYFQTEIMDQQPVRSQPPRQADQEYDPGEGVPEADPGGPDRDWDSAPRRHVAFKASPPPYLR